MKGKRVFVTHYVVEEVNKFGVIEDVIEFKASLDNLDYKYDNQEHYAIRLDNGRLGVFSRDEFELRE